MFLSNEKQAFILNLSLLPSITSLYFPTEQALPFRIHAGEIIRAAEYQET